MMARTALTSARVRTPLALADRGERILGGVAEGLDPRQVEEAAIALHGVDEAEDLVEPRAVVRRRFPGDEAARQRFQHLSRLGDEFVEKIVHGPAVGYGPL